jgi:hypothetical protein
MRYWIGFNALLQDHGPLKWAISQVTQSLALQHHSEKQGQMCGSRRRGDIAQIGYLNFVNGGRSSFPKASSILIQCFFNHRITVT